MSEPAKESQEHQPVFSKPAAYGISASAVVGAATIAVTSPQTFAAGLGSVGMSSAVFVTPVWRFIKQVNDLYTDISMYVAADWEKLRGHHFGPPSTLKREALAKHKPSFTRTSSYAVLAGTVASSGFLAIYAPSVLAAAFGSVIVSGASFTKPVIDLVRKVNELYVDTYNYVKGDLSKTKKVKMEPLVQDTSHEIDQSIYAPLTEKKPRSKTATYAILGATALGGALLAMTMPSLLVAAAGTIIGSAISYTAPALKFVKKVNHVYDKTEDHIIDGIDNIADKLDSDPDPKPQPQPQLPGPPAPGDQPLHISRPMAYAIAAGATLAGIGVIVYAPTLITAAIGGILGSASSFTTPVLKQVGKVNTFYVDACKYLKEDWQRIKGPAPTLPLNEKSAFVSVSLKPEKSLAEDFNKAASNPAQTQQTTLTTSFNKLPNNDNRPVAQPTASIRKPHIPKM
ncbi:MAG: hypothetical protein ACAH83_19500 [Alphaproteobacteria bacterium]